jgi:hypothetical protein
VAWVAERKDVLSTFFFILSLWAYASYAKAEVQGPKTEVQSPNSSTLILVLLDFWPLRRFDFQNPQ